MHAHAVHVDAVLAVEVEARHVGPGAPECNVTTGQECALDLDRGLVAATNDRFAGQQSKLSGRTRSAELFEQGLFLDTPVRADDRDIAGDGRVEVGFAVALRHPGSHFRWVATQRHDLFGVGCVRTRSAKESGCSCFAAFWSQSITRSIRARAPTTHSSSAPR